MGGVMYIASDKVCFIRQMYKLILCTDGFIILNFKYKHKFNNS